MINWKAVLEGAIATTVGIMVGFLLIWAFTTVANAEMRCSVNQWTGATQCNDYMTGQSYTIRQNQWTGDTVISEF